jgi:hypothetical protein
MKIPNLSNRKIADRDGNMTPEFHDIMSLLLSQLQQNNSNEGLFIPQQTSTNITTLNNQKSTAALIYNSETHTPLINVNGTFKTIQTS